MRARVGGASKPKPSNLWIQLGDIYNTRLSASRGARQLGYSALCLGAGGSAQLLVPAWKRGLGRSR